MTDIPDYPAAQAFLYSLKNRGAKYGIDRMRLLADALGHPERRFPAIHIAGTNGKGSVAAMLEAVHRAHGRRTGLYTSPHLMRQGERIQVDRRILEESEIAAYTAELKAAADRAAADDPDDYPSFFEFMTAMAFLHFAREGVDVALLETGLGGRLDATNVVAPRLAVITSISLDHVEQLGDTIAKIAAEKAGIVKPRVPVLLGRLPEQAEDVIRRRAAELEAPVHALDERFPNDADLPETNLEGSFQRRNAGLALRASEILGDAFPFREDLARDALRGVDWAGRWQRLELADRTLIFDASHNPEGLDMLDEGLRREVERSAARPAVVAGTLGLLRAVALIPVVARHAASLHLVAPDQPRAVPTSELRRLIPEECRAPAAESSVADLFPEPGVCAAGEPGSTVVVTGSIYLVGEAMARLTHGQPPSQGHLQDSP